jgi:hypothetical protein
MWTFLIVAIVHIPLYLLWLRFLQKKFKRDGLYELGDATETQFLMDPEESYSRKRQTAFHWAQILVLILLTCFYAASFWGTSDICIATEPNTISTRFTRLFYDDPCSGRDDPCFLYLTVGTNGSTSFKVFIHTGVEYTKPIVKISTTPMKNGNITVVNVHPQLTPEIKEYPRYLYTAELNHLSPGTTYYLSAGDQANLNSFSEEIKFRTIPMDAEFSFVIGGDNGASHYVKEMFKSAASYEPYFAAIGGDLTYDNGYLGCYPRVDTWLSYWQDEMVTPSGYTVPLITAIGNHEAGTFNSDLNNMKFYQHYFDSSNGTFFHEHYLGNLFLMALDSEIISSAQSQVPWMTAQLSTLPSNIRFTSALYHAPLYTAEKRESASSVSVRESWGPVFDQYNLTVGFENHSHMYKRTKLIRGGKEDASGTLYIGDGGWGVKPDKPGDYWYLANAVGTRNFVHVSVGKTNITLRAVNDKGEVFDSVTVV